MASPDLGRFETKTYAMGMRDGIPLPDVMPPPPISQTLLRPKPMPRVKVVDRRGRSATRQARGNYQRPVLEAVARAARAMGIPEDLALAIAIQEQGGRLAGPVKRLGGGTPKTFVRPMSLNYSPGWQFRGDADTSALYDDDTILRNSVDASLMHLMQGAVRQATNRGGLAKRIGSYNPGDPGYPDLIEGQRQYVVNASPDVRDMLARLQPSLSLVPMSMSQMTDVNRVHQQDRQSEWGGPIQLNNMTDQLDRQRLYPHLWK